LTIRDDKEIIVVKPKPIEPVVPVIVEPKPLKPKSVVKKIEEPVVLPDKSIVRVENETIIFEDRVVKRRNESKESANKTIDEVLNETTTFEKNKTKVVVVIKTRREREIVVRRVIRKVKVVGGAVV